MSGFWDDVLENLGTFLLGVFMLLFLFFLCYLLCYLQIVSHPSCSTTNKALARHGSQRSLVEIEEDGETDNTTTGTIPNVRYLPASSHSIEMNWLHTDSKMQKKDSFFQLPSDKQDTYHRFSLVDDDLGRNDQADAILEFEDQISKKMPINDQNRSLERAEFGSFRIKGVHYKRPCELLLNKARVIPKLNFSKHHDEFNPNRYKEVLI